MLFDIDEFGRPTIPSFFKKGEDGAQFMTLDALHAKYTFEKRPERAAFVEQLQSAGRSEQGGTASRAVSDAASRMAVPPIIAVPPIPSPSSLPFPFSTLALRLLPAV